jgi:hypothetical protein
VCIQLLHRDDPERRQQRAERDHQRRQHVRPLRHPVAAEQQHAEKGRFQEEGRDDFVGHQPADDAAGEVDVAAPVGAELERHDDARDHAQSEGDGEDLDPEGRQAPCRRRPS